jgi:hypothetical protein
VGIGTIDTIREVVAENTKLASDYRNRRSGETVRKANVYKELRSTHNKNCCMERNELYPVFLKLHNLSVLIVGGGNRLRKTVSSC